MWFDFFWNYRVNHAFVILRIRFKRNFRKYKFDLGFEKRGCHFWKIRRKDLMLE